MGTSIYFIFHQVELLGVSDHRVKKPKICPVFMNIYIFKVLLTGFHILQWVRKSYGTKVPPPVRSHRQYPPCEQKRKGGGGDDDDDHHGPNTN